MQGLFQSPYAMDCGPISDTWKVNAIHLAATGGHFIRVRKKKTIMQAADSQEDAGQGRAHRCESSRNCLDARASALTASSISRPSWLRGSVILSTRAVAA